MFPLHQREMYSWNYVPCHRHVIGVCEHDFWVGANSTYSCHTILMPHHTHATTHIPMPHHTSSCHTILMLQHTYPCHTIHPHATPYPCYNTHTHATPYILMPHHTHATTHILMPHHTHATTHIPMLQHTHATPYTPMPHHTHATPHHTHATPYPCYTIHHHATPMVLIHSPCLPLTGALSVGTSWVFWQLVLLSLHSMESARSPWSGLSSCPVLRTQPKSPQAHQKGGILPDWLLQATTDFSMALSCRACSLGKNQILSLESFEEAAAAAAAAAADSYESQFLSI